MPCGGIEPIERTTEEAKTLKDKLPCTQGGCCVCSKGGAYHFCHEWDTFIHARCVPQFLSSDEGQCVIKHKHVIYLDFSLEDDPNTTGS